VPKDANEMQFPSDRIPRSAWKTLAILSLIATMVMYAETILVLLATSNEQIPIILSSLLQQ